MKAGKISLPQDVIEKSFRICGFKHLFYTDNIPNILRCPICDPYELSPTNAVDHFYSVHNCYMCIGCKELVESDRCINHLVSCQFSLEDDEDAINMCSECGVETDDLYDHMVFSKHVDYCCLCNRHNSNIINHLHETHDVKYFCDYCPKNMGIFFVSVQDFLEHFHSEHTDSFSDTATDSLSKSSDSIAEKDSVVKDIGLIVDSSSANVTMGKYDLEKIDIIIGYNIIMQIEKWENYALALGRILIAGNYFSQYVSCVYFYGKKPIKPVLIEIMNIYKKHGIRVLWKIPQIYSLTSK